MPALSHTHFELWKTYLSSSSLGLTCRMRVTILPWQVGEKQSQCHLKIPSLPPGTQWVLGSGLRSHSWGAWPCTHLVGWIQEGLVPALKHIGDLHSGQGSGSPEKIPPVEWILLAHHTGNWTNLTFQILVLSEEKPSNSGMFSMQAENIFRRECTTLWPTLAIPTGVYRPPGIQGLFASEM